MNEEQHQLEILDKHIAVWKLSPLLEYFPKGSYNTYVSRMLYKRWREVGEEPSHLGVFSIKQLLFILNDIQINYLRRVHLYVFDGKRYLIRVYELNKNDPEEFLPEKDEQHR